MSLYSIGLSGIETVKITDNVALDVNTLKADIAKVIGDVPLNLLYLECCESTNMECMKLSEPCSVVIAEMQTAGRGRRGNDWHSPSSQNIYCSIGLQKSIKAEYLGLISLLVGVCIASVLRSQGVEKINLKWPNDILMQGKKLGGILIETRVTNPDDFYLVIGFGLNVNLHEDEYATIGQPVASLNQFAGETLDRYQLLSELIGHIIQRVMSFEVNSIADLIEQFHQFDSFKDVPVVVKTRSEEIMGHTVGIEDNGWLRVQTSDGIRSFSAAEISLRKQVS